MGALLGPVGGLLELVGSSAVGVAAESGSAYSTALSGVRREQRGPRPRRVWEAVVETATPEQWHALAQLDAGLMGPGPWVWYDELSQVTNLLTPEASTLDVSTWSANSASTGGAGVAEDGTRYFRSVVADPGAVVTLGGPDGLVPVPSGATVTVGAYVTAHTGTVGLLRVEEIDPQGAAVGTGRLVPIPTGLVGDRVHTTLTTHRRTVALRITTKSVMMLALPSVTLTDRPLPWAMGRGCLAASLTLPGETPQMAFTSATDWGRRSGYTLTITELG